MTKPQGTIRISGKNKLQKQGKKWVYIGYVSKPKPVFPPVILPDHIKATAYPCYYISNDGIAYREPRPRDASGCYGEINEWGLIEMKTQLRGNSYNESKMYESVNIYFYDENGKNIGYKKKNIHQLVAEAWIPNPNNYDEILHIDENNRNNHYTNLKWGTHKQNMQCKHLPEGTLRRIKGKKGSLYEKKNQEWVLVPKKHIPWNKGKKSGAPDGTIRKQSNGHYRIKINGDWFHLPKKDYIKHGL